MAGSTLIGVSGIVVSTNYAAAGRVKVIAQLQKMGTDVIVVTPRQSKNVAGRARTGAAVTTLRPADDDAVRRAAPEITASSEIVSGVFMLKAGDLSKPSCPIIGCQPRYVVIKDWGIVHGRFFDEREARTAARVAVLGYTVARDLFPDGDPIGKRLLINRVPTEVIGILAERGQGLDSSNEDNQVYVPISTAMTRLSNRTYLDSILFRVGERANVAATVKQVDAILSRRHRSRPGLRKDFEVLNQQATLDALNASSARLAFLIRSVGVSGLLVSGLGIFALCWIAIRDRTPELGVRRAIGAASSDVFVQIAGEAFLVSVSACSLAFAAAYALTRAAELRAQLPEIFDRRQAVSLVFAAIALNQIFGFAAAARAARIHPITALKYE